MCNGDYLTLYDIIYTYEITSYEKETNFITVA